MKKDKCVTCEEHFKNFMVENTPVEHSSHERHDLLNAFVNYEKDAVQMETILDGLAVFML